MLPGSLEKGDTRGKEGLAENDRMRRLAGREGRKGGQTWA